MHEPGSQRFRASTAGLLQLDGASLLCLTQPEHRSTQRELEGRNRGMREGRHTYTHTGVRAVLCLARITLCLSQATYAACHAAKWSLDNSKRFSKIKRWKLKRLMWGESLSYLRTVFMLSVYEIIGLHGVGTVKKIVKVILIAPFFKPN